MAIADWQPYVSLLPATQQLWRYISLEKCIHLFDSLALYLCQVERFDDRFEGSLTAKDREHLKQQRHHPDLSLLVDVFVTLMDWAKYSTYASCWHIADEENPQMWDEYVPKEGGVAIVSSIQQLSNSLSSVNSEYVYMREIEYRDKIEKLCFHGGETVWPFFYKKYQYFPELELRILQQVDQQTKMGVLETDVTKYADHILLPVDISTMVQKIVVLDRQGGIAGSELFVRCRNLGITIEESSLLKK